MMRLAATLLLGAVIAAQAPAAPADAIKGIFEPATGTPARPSAAVAWIAGDADPDFAFFGRTELPAGRTPDARTVYEIGSITKGLTGILLADMAIAGEVSIHDRLETLLPDGAAMPEAIRGVTLAQLATHASGLPRLPGDLAVGMTDPNNPYAHYDEARLLAFLRGYKAMPNQTIKPEYSNLGFGLLGYVLARKAGMPYADLLKARVLDPLGMHDTAITLSADQRARLAPGHAGGKPAHNWDLDALAGAGAVRSTAADMAKLLDALMHPPEGRIGRAIALALEPRGDLGAAKIGFGWITSARPDGLTFTWHNGGTGGYRTFLGFTRAPSRAGILVLTNGADEGPDGLAVRALEVLTR